MPSLPPCPCTPSFPAHALQDVKIIFDVVDLDDDGVVDYREFTTVMAKLQEVSRTQSSGSWGLGRSTRLGIQPSG